jgi:pimeloyl-ACP methyl ester carboxylesterase
LTRKPGKVFFRRSTLVAAGVVLAVAFVVGIAAWPAVSAQYRAAVTLSAVIENPATPLFEEITAAPRIEDTTVAGVPTLVAKPGGKGPHPAIVFMNGAVPPGREEPTVRDLAEGLARAGYAVYVPDVTGLRSGEVSGETASETVEVARRVAGDPDTRDGRVAFVGVSVGASLALLAAGDESLAGRVSLVSVVAPYTDLENVVRLATTGAYPGEGEYYPGGIPHYLRLVAARSLVSMLPEGEERSSLLRLVPELRHYYGSPPETTDPLAALPAFAIVNRDDLPPETGAVVELLTNRDPARFDELYDDLPPRMREEIDSLSPVSGAASIEAPVEAVSAPKDTYFPVAESREIGDSAPDFRLTVTEAMEHAEPEVSLEDLPAFLELNGFVVRSLEKADTRSG